MQRVLSGRQIMGHHPAEMMLAKKLTPRLDATHADRRLDGTRSSAHTSSVDPVPAVRKRTSPGGNVCRRLLQSTAQAIHDPNNAPGHFDVVNLAFESGIRHVVLRTAVCSAMARHKKLLEKSGRSHTRRTFHRESAVPAAKSARRHSTPSPCWLCGGNQHETSENHPQPPPRADHNILWSTRVLTQNH